MMRVLSLGGGVQSTALLLMSLAGDVEPLDAVIFADTGWEPQAVYDHIADLQRECAACEHGPAFHIVGAQNDLRADAIAKGEGGRGRFASLPLYALDPDGRRSMLPRQCTSQYKIGPINALIRSLGATRRAPVEVWIGISTDEIARMKPSRVQYVVNRWPLIEQRMRRYHCLHWLTEHGFREPPKSSCIGCPFHDDAYWRAMRDSSPAEWSDAVQFDAGIRRLPGIRGTCYLHRSCVPLGAVDLSSREDRGQLSMFDLECEGMCGL